MDDQDFKNLSPKEKMVILQNSVRSKTGGFTNKEPEELDKYIRVPGIGGIRLNPPVAPGAPDPEAAATQRMNDHIEAAMTGRLPAQPEQPLSEEEKRDQEIRQIRMKALQEASKTGKLPDYLKNI